MKKLICLIVVILMLTFLIPPQKVGARGGPGWFLPGLIVGGAIGLSLAPRYYYYPPAYYYPPPVYSYPVPAPNPPPAYLPPPSEEVRRAPSTGGEVFIYPRQGQSEEKQIKDRDACHDWAMNQTNYDPTKPPPAGMPQEQLAQKSGDYYRALGACLDGRGYTMR